MIAAPLLFAIVAVADVSTGNILYAEDAGRLDGYEALPGSVEKLLIAIAAIEARIAEPSLPRALATSDTAYFAALRAKLAPEDLASVGRRFGFEGELDRHRHAVRPRRLLELARALARDAPEEVREGMREAAEYGTAHVEDARVAFAGKTGTAERLDGKLCGWFIGFAPPVNPQVAVVAAVEIGHGSDAAHLASRAIDRVLAGGSGGAPGQASNEAPARAIAASRSPSAPPLPSTIVIQDGLEGSKRVALEEYVAGVVTAEEGDGTPESQKAVAVLARTFAVRERGRHGRVDFCPLTHCQAFHTPSAAGRAAAAATDGELLLIGSELAPAHYFSTCAGRTADSATIWPSLRPSLPGVSDDKACAASAHLGWRFDVPASKLEPVFGFVPQEIVVERDEGGWVRTASGRDGSHERLFGGEEMHLALARIFGWSRVKSANFTVERAGDSFVFRGRGLGHGVGLCQEGARGLSRRGDRYAQILSRYFPGSIVTRGRPAVSTAAVEK